MRQADIVMRLIIVGKFARFMAHVPAHTGGGHLQPGALGGVFRQRYVALALLVLRTLPVLAAVLACPRWCALPALLCATCVARGGVLLPRLAAGGIQARHYDCSTSVAFLYHTSNRLWVAEGPRPSHCWQPHSLGAAGCIL